MKKIDLSVHLSEHFTLREFVRSGVAIRCHIDNTPGAAEVERMRALCVNVLEPLRRRFGCLRITSGYRCPALNRAVGGVANSQHVRGEAADLHVSDREVGLKMYEYIQRCLPFDQLLFEHGRRGALWLHVSYRAAPQRNRGFANPHYLAAARSMAGYKNWLSVAA